VVLDRALELARVSLGDASQHIESAALAILAVGDGQLGAALVFPGATVEPGTAETATTDLKRLFAGYRELRLRKSGDLKAPGELPEWVSSGPESVEGLAFQLCDAVRSLSGRPTVLVLRDAGTREVAIVAVSNGADRRMLGVRVASDSVAGRACASDAPTVGKGAAALFGIVRKDRRANQEEGTAYPLRDGREGVGALVVMGPPNSMPDRIREQIVWLATNAGPKLGRAVTVRAAESRAKTDQLTGLPNRRALERAMASYKRGACSVLCVHLDDFKKLSDGFGHSAGDAGLRQVAGIFRRELRDGDLPCRLGGEEFALWLPGAAADRAMDVANRILQAVRGSLLEWNGAELEMTCSIGVASVPHSVSRAANLLGAADAALDRAKDSGRDRAVLASSG
jgi:diguanylate cyclase (GGDEF)-like protein